MVAWGCKGLGFGRGRIDCMSDLRHASGGEAALARMLADQFLIGCDVYAVDFVLGHMAVDPLYLRSKVAETPQDFCDMAMIWSAVTSPRFGMSRSITYFGIFPPVVFV